MVQLPNGLWALFCGKLNEVNSFIDIDDVDAIKRGLANYDAGYLGTDLNGNGYLDLDDLRIINYNFLNYVSISNPFE